MDRHRRGWDWFALMRSEHGWMWDIASDKSTVVIPLDLLKVCHRELTVNVVFWSFDLRTLYSCTVTGMPWSAPQRLPAMGVRRVAIRYITKCSMDTSVPRRKSSPLLFSGSLSMGLLIECCYEILGRGRTRFESLTDSRLGIIMVKSLTT